MIIRRAEERGQTRLSWLDSKHSFSFADYYDPAHQSFGALRVINEDRVARGTGFGAHPHRNMEILTYVVSGELSHRDSMGHGAVIASGELQLISAGSGVVHSEWNYSDKEDVHFLQIWLYPKTRESSPSYQQMRLNFEEGKWLDLAFDPENEKNGRQGLKLNQDAVIQACRFKAGEMSRKQLAADRIYWLQLVKGKLQAGEVLLESGDGLGLDDAVDLDLFAFADAEVLLFDLSRDFAG